jgi:hypothetical protein
MSSPFACNPKKSLFGGKAKSKEVLTPETVTLIADKSQVITAMIPYQTKQANTIRSHMHQTVLHEGQRIFIFRQVNGWTNISLESTENVPKLTCDPITTLITAYREFSTCPAVGNVVIKWKGSDEVLGYDDIAGMDGQFDPLPEASDDAETDRHQTDADVLYAAIESIDKKVDAYDNKLAHIVGIVERTYALVNGDDETVPASPDAAGSSAQAGVTDEAATVRVGQKRRKRP